METVTIEEINKMTAKEIKKIHNDLIKELPLMENRTIEQHQTLSDLQFKFKELTKDVTKLKNSSKDIKTITVSIYNIHSIEFCFLFFA